MEKIEKDSKMASIFDQYRRMWRIGLLLVCGLIILALLVVYFGCNARRAQNDGNKPIPPNTGDVDEIEIFREYLRIPSMHPNINYKPCVAFLERQAHSLDLPIVVHYPSCYRNPIVVITWAGSQPELPSIVLNSHMDVVPVYEDQWTHPPFAAEMDDEGRIFGRGAQDMKSVGTQYLGAIRALKKSGIEQLKRTVHVIFAPNEEIGGAQGWEDFVHTDEFKALNVGFQMDEGISSESDHFRVMYAERITFTTIVEITGQSGHGSLMLPNTVGPKARYMIDKMMDFRESEAKRLLANPNWTVSDVTTINLTMMQGGVHSNVVPNNVTLVFDVRTAIDVDLIKLKKKFEQWAREAGEDVTVYQPSTFTKPSKTSIDDSNPFWGAFQRAAEQLNITLTPSIAEGRTDASFVREFDIPAFGFTPINKIPILLHRSDEYITADIYMRGIDIYKTFIHELANIDE